MLYSSSGVIESKGWDTGALLDGLSACSAVPGQGVLRSSAAVPLVVYVVDETGLCVRMQGAVWGTVCSTHLPRNNGEKLPHLHR